MWYSLYMTKDEIKAAIGQVQTQFDNIQEELHRLQGEYRVYTRLLQTMGIDNADPAIIEVKEDKDATTDTSDSESAITE